MKLTERDKRGSTPLHWAVFQSSELAQIYLLGWLSVKELDIQDNEGLTAMHLAVRTAD